LYYVCPFFSTFNSYFIDVITSNKTSDAPKERNMNQTMPSISTAPSVSPATIAEIRAYRAIINEEIILLDTCFHEFTSTSPYFALGNESNFYQK